MKILLPDGSEMAVADGASAADVAAAIGPRLAKAAMAAKVGDRVVDLGVPLAEGDQVSILTASSGEGLDVIRHSAAHVLAEAATRLFPGTKVAIGPAIKDGFYYDFDFPGPVGEDDLPKLTAEMERLVAADGSFERREVSKEEAEALFADEPYKLELIRDLPADAVISTYQVGGFVDLCRGPHVPDTAKIGAVGLLSVAGAYWRGKSDNPMLTRIYGTAFPTRKELEEYLQRLEMARQRDHRKLGRELGLFSFHDEGPGFPFFHPKGMRVINALLDYWRREHTLAGYEETKTPIMLERTLWERSGHWDNYKDNMYFTKIDDVDFAVKPMNCPGGILIYKSEQHSYRDLPLRYAELGLVHRHEMSGVLSGLFRVRMFTQDDAHIYCLPRTGGGGGPGRDRAGAADVPDIRLRTGPRGAVHPTGEVHRQRRDVAEGRGGAGEGARTRGTGLRAQPRRRRVLRSEDRLPYRGRHGAHLAMRYVPGGFRDARETRHRLRGGGQPAPPPGDDPPNGAGEYRAVPCHPHRALWRRVACLGWHPCRPPSYRWPTVTPATRREVKSALNCAGLRAEADLRPESVGRKIRDGEVGKVPFMLVVGDREVEQGTVTIRTRGSKDTQTLALAEAATVIAEACSLPDTACS